MNPMQKSYSSFIESVCKQFDCTGAIRPLQDGFDALCESMTPGNQELVRYFRNLKPSSMQKDFSEMDGDVFTKHNPHFDRWVVHNTENAPEIYENGFRYGSEPGKLAYTDRYDSGRFAFATPLENATPPNFGENRPLPYCDTFDVGGSIVFKASGVTAFHKNDREDEVIFDKDSPEGCFWIRNVNHRAWENDTVDDDGDHELVDRYEVIGKNPDRPLCTGTYDRCIRWCRDNGDAYAHMMKRWKARGNATKTESMMTVNANSLCEAGDRTDGSAWDDVEWIHINHAADPRMDMDIKLDSLWATRQKDSVTRQDVINRFVEDVEDFNKWLATSEDGGAFITSAAIKFKGEPDAIAVDIPCPGGVEDLVSPGHNSLQESAGATGSPEIPGSFYPTTGVQAKVDAKLRQLGIVVDWSTYTSSRNRSWASQGMPSGTASAYTVSEAEKAGSYILANKRTICFYVSVSELARTPVEMYDVDTSMGSDYREIGVDTKFVPPDETVGTTGASGGAGTTGTHIHT